MFHGGDGASMPRLDGATYVLKLNPADQTDWQSIPTIGHAVWLAAMHLLGTPVAASTVIAAMHDPEFRLRAVEFARERIHH